MNGRIVELDASLHQKVEKLLPWLLIDGLPEAELELVRAHLQVCKPCRDDLAWQRKVQGVELPAMKGNEAGADAERAFAVPDLRGADVERAFAVPDLHVADVERAFAVPDLDVADVERAFAALLPRLAGAVQEPRRRPLAWLRRLIHGSGGWLRWALAAQGVAIAALAVALLSAGPVQRPAPGLAQYHALGAPPLARGNVVVIFQPATAEHELRRILRSSGARIVDGPSVTGVYLLELPDAQRAIGVATLRCEHAVVLAQSLDPGGRR